MSDSSWQVFNLEDIRHRLTGKAVEYLEFLNVPALNCGIYFLTAGSTDMQAPHDEDEVYYVLSGRARMRLGSEERDVFGDLSPSMPLMLFIIAMAGWMPMPTNGAVLISKWVCEKRNSAGGSFNNKTARSDFNIGFSLTVVLALCFLILGTAVLFDTGREMPAMAGGYAAELLRLFTTVLGSWSYPIIAAAGLAVMWSTQIALMDVMPRVVDRLLGIFQRRPQDAPPRSRSRPWRRQRVMERNFPAMSTGWQGAARLAPPAGRLHCPSIPPQRLALPMQLALPLQPRCWWGSRAVPPPLPPARSPAGPSSRARPW